MSQTQDALSQAKLALESGDVEAAEAVLEELDSPEELAHPEVLALRARIRCEMGEHLEAIKLLRTVPGASERAEVCYRMGTCWQHLSQWDSSEKVLRRAVALDSRHTDAFILLGTALYQQERHAEAVQAFERALVNDPRALLARYYLAQICSEQGNFKRALSQLYVLQTLKPDYVPTRRLQAGIFMKLQDFRQALVELCWLVEQGHADTWCFSAMGESYRVIGDKVQALKAYEFALRLDASLTDEMAYAAQINEELEQYESALELYQALTRDLQWGDRARTAVERLERRLSVIRLSAKPAANLPRFDGFEAPPVNQQPGTAPLAQQRQVRTQPLAMQEVEYEGPEPFLDRIKRNLWDLSGGRLDLDDLKERSQEVLDRLPLDALKDKLPEAVKKLPFDRLFGKRQP